MITTTVDRTRAEIEAATVELPDQDGRGVLVPGGLILTAAHCVRDGLAFAELALGEVLPHRIRTASGSEFRADLLCVEPRADIAVLMAPDNQSLPDDWEAFEEWAELTRPVQLAQATGPSLPAFVLNRDRSWVAADAEVDANLPAVSITTAVEIQAGASGGPVVTATGELLGVYSNCSSIDARGPFWGRAASPPAALPVWVLARITNVSDGR